MISPSKDYFTEPPQEEKKRKDLQEQKRKETFNEQLKARKEKFQKNQLPSQPEQSEDEVPPKVSPDKNPDQDNQQPPQPEPPHPKDLKIEFGVLKDVINESILPDLAKMIETVGGQKHLENLNAEQ